MKKIICAVLALAMSTTLLAGCNTDSTSSKSNATPSANAAAGETAVNYPNGPISLVVPAAAGGGTDLSARVFAQYATEILGKPVIVTNVTGGGGSAGTKQVYDAAPDGQTVLFFHNNVILNKLSGTSTYSFDDGFEVGPKFVSDGATGFYGSASGPFQNTAELVEYAKAHPGEVKMATEVGGYTYFMILSLEQAAGVKFNMIDVGGNSEKCTSLLGGHIDVMPNQYGTAKGYIESGDFTALGFPSAERSAIFPDVPTIKEQGIDYTYPGYEFGFFFPKGTSQEIIDLFDACVKQIADEGKAAEDIQKLGFQLQYKTPADFKAEFTAMQEMYTELAAKAATGAR